MTQDVIQEKLFKLADENYKSFHSSLCPGVSNIIGVRVPILRNYAKELYKTENWKEILNFNPKYYEEIMLQGMIIGFIKKEPLEVVQKYIKGFITEIDNWAICDTFVTGLKITNKYLEQMWEFIQKYLKSNKEFEIRFGVVMLLNYYITDDYVNKVLKIFDAIKSDDYYVKMAIAWAISICYIKYNDITYQYLKNDNLDKYTHNKSIQKIKESYRVTDEEKEKLELIKCKN